MKQRDNFLKAIKFEGPVNVPINGEFNNKYRNISDAIGVFGGCGLEEWGINFTRLDNDKTMGQVKNHPIATVEDYDRYELPPLDTKNQFCGVKKQVDEHKKQGRFVFGLMASYIFERMHYLRGMESLFEDMYMEPERFQALGDKITDFQIETIKAYALAGVDGIWGGDDWGLQDRLMISPELWRKFFKPWYTRMFMAAKEYGIITYMHSCGYISDIIGDLIDAGLNVIEIQQPTIMGIEKLGKEFGGKICFSCSVDIQKTMPNGNREEIESQVIQLKDNLGCFNGGLIYLFYPDYSAIGVDDHTIEFLHSMYDKYRKY